MMAATKRQPHRFPVRVSYDGSYLVDAVNRPFFINGDAGWSLIVQLSRDQAQTYLDDRAAKGFNAILVNLIDHAYGDLAPANRDGQRPFLEDGRFDTPNEAYFAHADWIIAQAEQRGMLVLLAPLYLGFDCGPDGWCAETKSSSYDALRAYGHYLRQRFAAHSNIVWVVGGDADVRAHGMTGRLRAFAESLIDRRSARLVSAHNQRGQAAMDVWNALNTDRWLNLNNVYTGRLTYPKALEQSGWPGRQPLFLIESNYENEQDSTPRSLRSQAYWAVLSGALAGHVFGNCPIWHFGTSAAKRFCAVSDWVSELNSPGSQSLPLVGRLFSSRRFFKLVPDRNHSVIIDGVGSGADYAAAAYAPDGTLIIIYLPSGRSVRVDLSRVGNSRAKVWWFDPRTGSSTLVGAFPTDVPRSFSTPTDDDWVLVVDRDSLNLPAPGLPDTP